MIKLLEQCAKTMQRESERFKVTFTIITAPRPNAAVKYRITFRPIPGFTFTVVNEFRRFLRQFSINFHEILHTLFSINVVTTLKVSRSFDEYLKS